MNWNTFLVALTPFELEQLRDAINKHYTAMQTELTPDERNFVALKRPIDAIKSIRERKQLPIRDCRFLIEAEQKRQGLSQGL